MSDDPLVFVDTSILLYARDAGEPVKQPVAARWMRDLWESRRGRISFQVLNEFFVNATRKVEPPLDPMDAWGDVESLMLWDPVVIDGDLHVRGYRLFRDHSLSWWDALIVAAAQSAGCSILLSEDLSHGQLYAGVRVVNPFGP